MDHNEGIQFMTDLAKKVEPQVDHICDYFLEENIDGPLGEFSLVWTLAMSIAIRARSLEELEQIMPNVVTLLQNISQFIFVTKGEAK